MVGFQVGAFALEGRFSKKEQSLQKNDLQFQHSSLHQIR